MENWKDIKGYEGKYQVSDLGRVKSLKRWVDNKCNGGYFVKEMILKSNIKNERYPIVGLTKNNTRKKFRVHQLVAMAFLNHIPNGNNGLTVDHIDSDVSNNCISNLQLLTGRENSVKHTSSCISSSKYTGVSWHNHNSKWMATIYVNKTKKYLGSYTKEIDAHLAYKKALKEIALLNE